jgi:hypothetical protein
VLNTFSDSLYKDSNFCRKNGTFNTQFLGYALFRFAPAHFAFSA